MVASLIGEAPNHWVYHSDEDVMDLTRPELPNTDLPPASSSVRMKTDTHNIVVSPSKSALVIIDMQNLFLSPALGRDPEGPGNKAREVLIKSTIPAARKAGIRTVWLNWGLNDEELRLLPPSIQRSFGRMSNLQARETQNGSLQSGHKSPLKGPGVDIGLIQLPDGTTVEGGKLLYADTWNTALPPDLQTAYEQGLKANPPDIWIHKNRMSGLWGGSTPCTEFLDKEGLRTLFFAGVNTDQCVGGSLQDAFSKGYDAILVKDGCGTTSPDYARKCMEFNGSETFGFVVESDEIRKGVEKMLMQRQA